MRLDHVAFRVAEGKRDEATKFWCDAFGYKIQDEFPIYFDDEHKDMALCIALEPPEKHINPKVPFILPYNTDYVTNDTNDVTFLHLAPEIFISQGTPGSIVDEWVKSRGGFGGIHHLAYQVTDVEDTMQEWLAAGYGNFSSDKPIYCKNGLVQVFSKPNVLGVVFEFINRGPSNSGFCKESVKELMESSKGD